MRILAGRFRKVTHHLNPLIGVESRGVACDTRVGWRSLRIFVYVWLYAGLTSKAPEGHGVLQRPLRRFRSLMMHRVDSKSELVDLDTSELFNLIDDVVL